MNQKKMKISSWMNDIYALPFLYTVSYINTCILPVTVLCAFTGLYIRTLNQLKDLDLQSISPFKFTNMP